MVVGDCSRWPHLWFLYCRWDKTRRASSDKDKPEDITRGEAYHNHGLRKVSANAAVCGMSSWICRYQIADKFTIVGSLCCCLMGCTNVKCGMTACTVQISYLTCLCFMQFLAGRNTSILPDWKVSH